MTAQKRVVLTCDTGRCRSRYLGGLSEPLGDVRRRAKKDGWDSWTISQDMFRVTADQCPRHR